MKTFKELQETKDLLSIKGIENSLGHQSESFELKTEEEFTFWLDMRKSNSLKITLKDFTSFEIKQ